MIKKILLPLTILFAATGLVAQGSAEPIHNHPFLNQQPNQVIYDLTEEAWVSTETARVVVVVNASLKDDGLSQLRGQITEDLNKIAQGQWHITQFSQTQDNTGLDTVSAIAEARLSADDLTNVYSQADELSQPGIAFRIQYIDFNPSLEELDQARTELREKIYGKVNAEIQRLNQQFPEQAFKLHQLNFLPEYSTQMLKMTREMDFTQSGRTLPSAMNVSTNIKLTAAVTLSSEADRHSDRVSD